MPDGIAVTALPGGNGVLEVTALTLREGEGGAELYAAVRNGGEVEACSAALSVELFDHAERSLTAAIGGLLTQDLYRLTDGSGAVAACLGPGDVSMGAITDLPADMAVEDVGTVLYRTPYFALDVVAIDGLVVTDLRELTRDGGTAYAGTLVNHLDVVVHNPSVSVFPVDRVGRPLGMTVVSGAIEVAPGGSWSFETDTLSIDARAVDHFAYPAGALAD